jgi:hypothetical protein
LSEGGSRIGFWKISRFIKKMMDIAQKRRYLQVAIFAVCAASDLVTIKKTARKSITSVSFIRADKENGHFRCGVQVDIPAK